MRRQGGRSGQQEEEGERNEWGGEIEGYRGEGRRRGIKRKAGTAAQSPSGALRGFVLQVLPAWS